MKTCNSPKNTPHNDWKTDKKESNMQRFRHAIMLVGLIALTAAHAQVSDSIAYTIESRIDDIHYTPERSLMLGIGNAHLLDTYLSPEEYSGTEIRIIGQTELPLKYHPEWRKMFIHQGYLQQTSPRSDDNQQLSGLYAFDFAMKRWWQVTPAISIAAGGQAEAGIGFAYNTRNGNNPAQARAYLNLGPSAAADWQFQNPLAKLFRWKKNTWKLRYDVYAPLFGALFSPNYGQSYYEIFSRGNYDHNIVPTTPICAPTLRHQIVLNIPFWRGTLQLGYLGDFQQAKVNNLKYHTYAHLFLIGYIFNK